MRKSAYACFAKVQISLHIRSLISAFVVRCVWQYPKVKNYSDTQTNCCSKFPKYSDIQKN